MVAKFLNVTQKFTETLEDMRKQELMESRYKASRKSLDFDAFKHLPESANSNQRRRADLYS